jgi:acyl-CoA synthetase (NDP forming)
LQPQELAMAVLSLASLGQVYAPDGASGWTIEEIEINPAVTVEGRLVALDGIGLISRTRWPEADRPLAKIIPLLEPRSAVVMGVSARGVNPGRIILDNLRRARAVEAERLYVVHHQERDIAGVPCYPSVTELPEKVDLAVVAIPAESAREAIAALVDGDRAESIILIPGGFAETGETGLATAIESKLREGHARPGGGPIMVGGNCLGIVSRNRYNTFFLPPYKLPYRPGRGENLAMISQSGAYLVTFASNYDGLIYPKASISFGNQMDLTVSDLLAHFIEDDEVDVIACYVEGFRTGDGARFLEYARRARAARKRVIACKAGKTELGAKAAASHTASLAGNYEVARACLSHAGVSVAESLDEFEDLIKTYTLLARRRPAGRRVGILSNAGFECSTVMDRLAGLELAVFTDETRASLREALPPFAHRDNPIDTTPIADTDAYGRATAAVLACETVDLAIISAIPVTPSLNNLEPDPWGGHRENIWLEDSQPRQLIRLLSASNKPAVVVIDSGRLYDPMAFMIERAGIPVFRKIDRAARALAAFCTA